MGPCGFLRPYSRHHIEKFLGDLFLIIFLMKAGARDFMVNVAIIHFKERYCWNTK